MAGWGKELSDFLSADSSVLKVPGDSLGSVKILELKSLPHPHVQYGSTHSLENLPPACSLP